VAGDERKWLEEFRRINGFDSTGAALNERCGPRRVLSNDPAQPALRKGPHRLGNIIDADPLAIRITNRRARAGLKPTKFSR
jgi:hypothetical protein